MDEDFERDDDYGQGSLPPPDWDRYKVTSRAQDQTQLTALGDPTRWGGSVKITTEQLLLALSLETPQFMRVQCGTPLYPRLWALTGTVEAHPDYWLNLAANFALYLRIIQGAGQGIVDQNFDLRVLSSTALASGYAFSGPINGTPGLETRPFAIIGGVLGLQWSATVQCLFTGAAPPVGSYIRVNVIATPLAAGHGL